jgi:phosphoserine phosphatase RsbU/P
VASGHPRKHALAYIGLAVLFLFAVAMFGQRAYDNLTLVSHQEDRVRPPFYLGDANWGLVSLQPEAEAAGVRNADELLSINGKPISGFIDYYGLVRAARPGDRLRVQVRQPGPGEQVRDLDVELHPYRSDADSALTPADAIGVVLTTIVLPVVCLTLGFWVAAVRIRDRSAWLLLALLISLPAGYSSSPADAIFGRANALQPVIVAFGVFFGQIAAPVLMLFGIVFPERLPLDRRFPWFTWLVAGYLFIVAAISSTAVALWIHDLAFARQWTKRPIEFLTGVQGDFGAAVVLIALVVCAGSLGWKAVTATRRDTRRRLQLLFAGAAPGIAALVATLIASRLEIRLPPWSELPLITMVLIFPLTMAYVIVVHRAMDVRIVVRQGLQYVLARGGIRVIQILLLVAVSVAAASFLSGGVGFGRVALVVAALVTIVGLGRRFADRVRGWVDRRFFREAYEADAILSDLAAKVRTIVETGPLLETVAARIVESLHVSRLAILLVTDGAFRPAHAIGYGVLPDVSIPEHGLSGTRLQKQPHALASFDDSDSWVHLTGGDERAALETLKPELLLALSLNEKLLGLISLGAKQSEEPYSKTDLRLLDSVATQTGLALENGRLTEAIKLEVRAREKHRRELEIAHEVQERLFPQVYPPVTGLDYAGACRPALGVGGDYYDFIPLSKTELGIAIGDISGKGMPAALLMATLRAYVRGLTSNRQIDLASVMSRLNQLVFESSAANRYATFFYAEFDATSRTLTYVNAGHNAPMVFKTANRRRDVVRLDAGGPVIGLMEDCLYRQDRVTLDPGDVLVAFTDGISEAMNDADEEWGEERLIRTVQPHCDSAAATLIDQLMGAADDFVAGAPQHDDMTLIVLRTSD